MHIDTLNNNSKEQNKLLLELRYELVQSEDLKDELETKDQSMNKANPLLPHSNHKIQS